MNELKVKLKENEKIRFSINDKALNVVICSNQNNYNIYVYKYNNYVDRIEVNK